MPAMLQMIHMFHCMLSVPVDATPSVELLGGVADAGVEPLLGGEIMRANTCCRPGKNIMYEWRAPDKPSLSNGELTTQKITKPPL
jgi:hypothetical protein